jgi:hypothetical protein
MIGNALDCATRRSGSSFSPGSYELFSSFIKQIVLLFGQIALVIVALLGAMVARLGAAAPIVRLSLTEQELEQPG